ncbi:MAG: hypothetical protein ABS70_04885 [Nitrospira sp. SCN 59-13]|nr:MAG: hypothetical protein ABS70_04885 [Nitrospira sp. SCN 59-13]
MGLATAFISFNARLDESLGAGVDVQAATSAALSSRGTTQTCFMQASLQNSQTAGILRAAQANGP